MQLGLSAGVLALRGSLYSCVEVAEHTPICLHCVLLSQAQDQAEPAIVPQQSSCCACFGELALPVAEAFPILVQSFWRMQSVNALYVTCEHISNP